MNYRFSFPAKTSPPPQLRVPLTASALAAMTELKGILKQKTATPAQIIKPSVSTLVKPFHFKDYPKANLAPYIQPVIQVKNTISTNESQRHFMHRLASSDASSFV